MSEEPGGDPSHPPKNDSLTYQKLGDWDQA